MSIADSWPRPSRYRNALKEGAPPLCMWVTLQSTNLIELAAAHGLDTVIIDQEHTTSELDVVRDQIRVAQLGGVTALVRPPSVDPHTVGRILDAGADGIVFPGVSSVEDAQKAAAAVRYPPRGTRGWAGTHARHVRWNSSLVSPEGAAVLSPEFVAAADDSIASVFMVESVSGLEQLEDILEVGTPDAVIFGVGDFLLEVEFDRARVAQAKQQIYETCRRHNVGIALSIAPPDEQPYYPGCFFFAGVDAAITSEAIRERLRVARSEIARQTGLSAR
jgi:2-keto-3-deoxy-L-rhamnonate aldolase RhmA